MRAHDPGKAAAAEQRRGTAGRSPAPTPLPARAGGGAAALGPEALLALQRSVGNSAVTRMLQRSAHEHSAGCGHGDETAADLPSVQRSGVDKVLSSAGSPLDGPLKNEMEARLGADFSDVRLHTGTEARRSSAELGARAFTSGSHVVIGDGGGDKHTLAHELTHVIQQRTGPVAGTDNGDGLRVSDPSDRFEREAEANASRVLSGPAPEAPLTAEEG